MGLSVNQILRKFEKADDERNRAFDYIQEVCDYVWPNKKRFFGDDHGERNGQKREITDLHYDSTATSAANTFVSNIQTALTPPKQKWAKIEIMPTAENAINEQRSAEELLGWKKFAEKISDILFSSINNSNFDTQIAESYSDMSVSTGVLLIHKGESANDPLVFEAVPMVDVRLEKGIKGDIRVVFRKMLLSWDDVYELWPDIDKKRGLSAEFKKLLDDENKSKDTKLEFIECTYPSDIISPVVKVDSNKDTKIGKNITKGFTTVVIHKETKSVISEIHEKTSPWVVFRWTVTPGELYGRGPLMSVFSDIKSLNFLSKITLVSAAFDALGLFTAKEDGLLDPDTVKLSPGNILLVEDNPGGGGQPSIAPLPRGTSFQLPMAVIQRLSDNINKELMADALGPNNQPVKTATEIMQRQQDFARRRSQEFSRVSYELVTPVIVRCLDILNDFDYLADEKVSKEQISDLISDIGGANIGLKVKSPLSVAQDRNDLESLQLAIQSVASITGPQALLGILDMEKMIRLTFELAGASEGLLATPEQFEAMRRKIAQVGQAEEQMATQELEQ